MAIRALRKCFVMGLAHDKEIAVRVPQENEGEFRALLDRCAATALSSKLVAAQKEFCARLVVDAVLQLDPLLPLHMIGIKKACYSPLPICPPLCNPFHPSQFRPPVGPPLIPPTCPCQPSLGRKRVYTRQGAERAWLCSEA